MVWVCLDRRYCQTLPLTPRLDMGFPIHSGLFVKSPMTHVLVMPGCCYVAANSMSCGHVVSLMYDSSRIVEI